MKIYHSNFPYQFNFLNSLTICDDFMKVFFFQFFLEILGLGKNKKNPKNYKKNSKCHKIIKYGHRMKIKTGMESLNGIFSSFYEIIEHFFHFGGIRAPPKPLKTSISFILGGLLTPPEWKKFQIISLNLENILFKFSIPFLFYMLWSNLMILWHFVFFL